MSRGAAYGVYDVLLGRSVVWAVLKSRRAAEMSQEDEPQKPEDSTLAVVLGMLISVLASLYILYISGTIRVWW